MKRLLFGALLLSLGLVFPIPAPAGVDVNINIGFPPPIRFSAPPEMVVIPESYVYVVPDMDEDIFFYNGWWWRPWRGRWYRSRHYNSGWIYYRSVPTFYGRIPSTWRNDYRNRRWAGHQWNYRRIPQQQLQRNWSNWQRNNYWERQQTWGVQGLRPQTQPRQIQPQQRYSPQTQPVKPQFKQVQPQHIQPQSQQVKPQFKKVEPQHIQPQHLQPQQGAGPGPQQSNPQHGKPEKGREGKRDK